MGDIMEENNKKSLKDGIMFELLDLVRIVLVCFVCVFICVNFLFKPVRVEGISMYPTLEDQEYGFSNVFSALLNDFNRFDVVVVKSPSTNNDNWVKRIIGLPNETIEFKDDQLYIDGKKVKEPFLDKAYVKSQKKAKNAMFTEDFGPIQLGEDEYYLMGDNRPYSHDSRAVGAFKKEYLVSKSVLILYPFDKMGLVNDGTK
ncbi:MAG: signal peptidase I [Erysipelotrichia bacterium]|nr:signal peptidase I [Erysipelotrichia bacterium]NCC54242.1 signal peptidase I [Erysipelotrichia bacterium]